MDAFTAELREFIRRIKVAEDREVTLRRNVKAIREGMGDVRGLGEQRAPQTVPGLINIQAWGETAPYEGAAVTVYNTAIGGTVAATGTTNAAGFCPIYLPGGSAYAILVEGTTPANFSKWRQPAAITYPVGSSTTYNALIYSTSTNVKWTDPYGTFNMPWSAINFAWRNPTTVNYAACAGAGCAAVVNAPYIPALGNNDSLDSAALAPALTYFEIGLGNFCPTTVTTHPVGPGGWVATAKTFLPLNIAFSNALVDVRAKAWYCTGPITGAFTL